jgi:hypothetical protein
LNPVMHLVYGQPAGCSGDLLVPSSRANSFGCRGFRMVGALGLQYVQGLASSAVVWVTRVIPRHSLERM